MSSVTQDANLSWRQQFASLGTIWPLFRLLWATSPSLFIGTIALRLARAVLPVVLLWIPKQILDGIIAISRHTGDVHRVWHLLLLEFILGLVGELLSQSNNLLDGLLGEHFTCYVATRLMDHAASLDLASFEDPVFYDKLERVRSQATGRVFVLTSVLNAAQEVSTLVSVSVGVILFSPWLIVLLIASTIPTFIAEARYSKLSYGAFFRRTPERRELEYVRLLASWAQSAKEVKTFGLGSHLTSRYRSVSARIYKENKDLAIKRGVGGWCLGILSSISYYAGYVLILRTVLAEAISLGTFTFLTGSLMRSRLSTERIFAYLNGISEQAVLLNDLFEFFKMAPVICSPPNALPIPCPIREGFEFRDVSFAYPGCEKLVLQHISLRIGRSERVALIGENGSGKTTIVKLLLRLYDPTSGQILLDGVDLRDYDVLALRTAMSAIFQDFMRYDLPVRDNIGFGDLDSRSDDYRLDRAAQQGGATDLLGNFPLGYDQVLGRRFKYGVELSGGEWQKIALARMLVREAQLFILDEPTASLDVRSEHELFERLGTLLEGRMAVMISHRLSTVRSVDKIVVLENGAVLEQGTHESLVTLGGRYADLFNIEAAAFRDYGKATIT
jgi:ATP-binding cassette, subfamily B, bacterial